VTLYFLIILVVSLFNPYCALFVSLFTTLLKQVLLRAPALLSYVLIIRDVYGGVLYVTMVAAAGVEAGMLRRPAEDAQDSNEE
jgi:uncharacterized membrane protein